ncbi:hypothetical protein P152DRAFT_455062 [Eremomyces bilateralis CBS 781.70]|uniref:SMAD/FHA domain-containing protein n=1 Tax=Eremomyces bilateralis CBS 781.70 TaxID=1392243 RepID=A0A6G1GBM8_9PEZI|nr:uncharacterized protein P152DRAFT_455062 [Eremomyces bilateralis CBS 781.70]KAF1815346.1 hypothetical protein P152DRAFT_455062 [Eremomyces bilateralis CBS 781.70]
MFTTPAPAPPTLSTSTSPVTSSSPPRLGRLRGLSYLRNYTHTHLNPLASSPTSSLAQPPANRPHHTPPVSPVASSSGSHRNGAGISPRIQPSHLYNNFENDAYHDRQPSRRSVAARAADYQYSAAVNLLSQGTVTMTRNRAETAASTFASQHHSTTTSSSDTRNGSESSASSHALPSIRFLPHHDPRASKPSLQFAPITRTLATPTAMLKVGRYSERESAPEIQRNGTSAAPVGFKSKVVSRRHCEFWCTNSQWYIKDVKSSSGTFLNHIRLSAPGVESKPYPLNDGDIVQLGIDFRGGEEMIFRCVKIRIECNRGWQKGLNAYNKSTHKNLRKLASKSPRHDTDNASNTSSECAICLAAIAPCQSLFVAPCSHVWHYKCIRPILISSTHPHFLCPNCRAVADLDADVDEADNVDWEDDDIDAAIEESKKEAEQQKGDDLPQREASPQLAVSVGQEIRETPTDAGDTTRVHVAPDTIVPVAAARSLAIDQNPSADANGLSSMLANVSLSPGPAVMNDDRSHTLLAPIPIPTSTVASRALSLGLDGTEESEGGPPNLGAGDAHPECPMTPRNDVGPFLVEGGRRVGSSGVSVEAD